MKKLFTPLLLLVLLLVGTEAWAGYSLKVAGYDVNTSGTSVKTITGSNITGTITYDPTNRRLTLNNATIDCSSYGIYASGYTNGNDLDVCFYGTNTIKTDYSSPLLPAIYVGGRSRVYMYSGSLTNGPAIVNVINTGNGPAIRVPEKGSRIDIVKLRLYAEASNNHCVQGSAGEPGDYIFAPNDSYIDLKAPEGRNALYGFTGWYAYVNNLSQAYFLESGHSWSSSKGGIVDASGNLVSSTTIVPPLTLGGVPFSSGYDWSVTTSSTMASYIGLTAGTISYVSNTKTLTMNGVTMNSGSKDLLDSFVSGLTVNLTGTNTLTTSSICMDLYGGTTLSGSGSLTANSMGSTVYMNYGRNCPLTINVNGTVRLNGHRAINNAASSIDNPNNDLILKKAGDGSDYYFKSDEGNETISRVCHLKMEDMDFYTARCYFDENSRQIKKTGGEVVTGSTVNIRHVSQWYNLWVAGHQLSDVTAGGRFGSPYLKTGTVSYDAAKTLTISGATIEMPSGEGTEYCSIYSLITGLTINATGTNSWKSEFFGLNLGGNGTTTIKGSGALNITSTASAALNMFGTNSLTLARSSGVMAVKGKTYGFCGRPYTKLSINKAGSGAIYEFAGETANIGNIPTLDLGSGVHISTNYQWFNEEQEAVYNKNTKASSSSPTNASATWIRSDLSWVDYPIYIAGTQLYGTGSSASGNVGGFWNKYVKGGYISYDYSTNTLTLNNASIDYTAGSSTNDGIITTNRGTTLNVAVIGENTLDGATPYAGLWLNYSTVTISGSGTLSVTGGTRDNVYGLNGSTITVKGNVTLEAPTHGIGTNNPAENLVVAENAVVKARQISCLNKLTLLDDRGIIAPARAMFNASNRRVEVDGVLARDVVIGKLETYDLVIAGTYVTNANCSDILGNGVFSYDNDTKTLTINGNYEYEGRVIESHIEDLTINVASESNLVSTQYNTSIISLLESTTITGGVLRMGNTEDNGIGISLSYGSLTLDHAQIDIDYFFRRGIEGGGTGTKLIIKYSDITATTYGFSGGAICDWDGITMEGCWVIEPLTAQILSSGIADADGNIVGRYSGGTLIITSDRDLYDGIHSVSTDEAVPSEVYDLSGRKLGQARSGVNIIRRKDGRVVKELHK